MVNLVTLPAELILTNRQISVLTQMNRVVSCKIIWNCLKHLTVIITGELGFGCLYGLYTLCFGVPRLTKLSKSFKLFSTTLNSSLLTTSPAIACSKLTIETFEQGVKYV